MKAALILLAMLAITGLLLYLLDKWYNTKASPTEENAKENNIDSQVTGCTDDRCVLHDNCPSEQLLRGACEEKIVYYDDEELDAYIGRNPDDYNDDDLEQFRDVMYTLRHDELLSWYQSISRRGIKLSDGLYHEFIELASDNQQNVNLSSR